jgi:O-antigen/teichoic acid export membrane protein
MRKGRRSRLDAIRQAVHVALPADQYGDHLTILSGTGQNIAGLVVFVAATFATNVLISRAFGTNGATVLGTVTLATQFAFIAGAATRFGMDHAAVRRVSIEVGEKEPGRGRAIVARAAAIAAVVSLVGGLLAFIGADALARAFGVGAVGTDAFRAAALALPFVALCQVYLGGTRGLKIMRHTLSIFWVGQPLAWIGLMVTGWVISKSVGMSVLSYAASWILATVAAWFVWERETAPFPALPAEPGEVRELVKYGTPRAPAAVLSQLLFWTDYFVYSRYASGPELGVYAAAVRVAQALILFLTAVNYMFSPFVADLHNRGERDRLDGLYKALTRWVVMGTLPVLLLLLVVPGPVLRIFGASFESGTTPLRILLIGQAVNVAVGSVGFILIMVGRTGWDLVVYAGSFLIDLVLSFALASRFGAEGAATAQAVTLVVSNTARLWLVWRFVHIQPFDRNYVRLAIPAATAGIVMVVIHLALRGSSWPVDLIATGAAGAIAYVPMLVAFGLAPAERRAVTRILGRESPSGPAPA